MDMKKWRIMVVGGTGYMGRRIVRASLREGHPTYVLTRPETELGLDIEKVQMLLSFKKEGAQLLHVSLHDHEALVCAIRQVDVVVSALAGNHIRSHAIPLQLKLVQAIKDAANIKRFVPSEFGMDADRMKEALQPGSITFSDKRVVRRAVEAARIPFTYVPAGCFAGYFVGNLAQMGRLLPPKDNVVIYGDGNTPVSWVDEDDVATYVIKCVGDPRCENKTVYVRPPENVLSQSQLVDMWERLSGVHLHRSYISGAHFLDLKNGQDLAAQVGLTHFYHIFYDGSLCNFQLLQDDEASALFPEVDYVRIPNYLKRFV